MSDAFKIWTLDKWHIPRYMKIRWCNMKNTFKNDVIWHVFVYIWIPDIFLSWRNFGYILFVLQNSWHFQTVEEFWIYFIYTNQNWAPIFQIMTLFYLYWHFQSQLGILWEYISYFIFYFIYYILYLIFHILFFYILFFISYFFIFYFLYFIFLYFIFYI